MTITIDQFIEQNVIANVSALVRNLALEAGFLPPDSGLKDMCWQAADACSPVDDYDSAAMDAGWRYAKDTGSWEFGTELAIDAREVCAREDLDPYEHEILEHYFVSDRLADHLERHGERIVRDFAGHNVWGRTTSGQAIKLDPVIETIFAETQSR